ncbi:hypothetical protein SprV_0401418600 [Sparganum proliferum]
MHHREGCLVVTSFRTEHVHEPVPVKPQRSEQKNPDSQLTDFHTLRPSSSKTDEQTAVLCYLFKKIMRSGVYDSFDDLMSAVRAYEEVNLITDLLLCRLPIRALCEFEVPLRVFHLFASRGLSRRYFEDKVDVTEARLHSTFYGNVGKRPQHTGDSGNKWLTKESAVSDATLVGAFEDVSRE